ncbi:hypothetical protein M3484_04320 [Pseudomonas sp. GX19020]|uniref:hypothetical protein n=1 Tax=Pseudomonas sp. GX19020 TaxID=2942277 RepID=UPI0020198CAB|nr:hypothetical protein [Pseudomonas sp. GX19020]MCL4065790.1 hypothetical protein [Pseudomonas sp. GX19020]
MNDISRKRHALTRGPVLAAIVFALAYGSAMMLVIAPRGLLGGSQPVMAEGGMFSGAMFSGGAASDQPQLLRAGFTPVPSDRSAYGIRD